MSSEGYRAARVAIDAIASALARHGGEGVEETLARLAAQDLSEAAFAAPEPARIAACRLLPETVGLTLGVDSAVAAAIADVEDALAWRQTAGYSDAAMGQPGFMEGYGHAELVGPTGGFPGDDFRLGLLILGPDRHYRDHYHPAPELYWTLTGPTLWKRGAGGFVERAAGDTVWHEPLIVHATRTLDTPLLAVWAWTRDVSAPARLV